MSSDFIYGVFKSEDDFSKALSSLKTAGYEDVSVINDTESALYKSAKIISPLKSYFLFAGAAGAIIGGIAGALAAPKIPYTTTFQVLTPMMAMVSGAIVCAYFAVWVCGFLNWLDKPMLEADVFEGSVTNGSILLAVTADTREKKIFAMTCMESSGAVELIVRANEIGGLEQVLFRTEEIRTVQPASVQLAA